jgi:hypothetical protein
MNEDRYRQDAVDAQVMMWKHQIDMQEQITKLKIDLARESYANQYVQEVDNMCHELLNLNNKV